MDPLAPDAVVPLLHGRFGQPYLYARECPSTQLLLLDSALPEGAVAVTEHQTAGRGRHGRSWVAPPGTALLCSVLLRPPAGRRAAELSLVAGLAVAEALDEATGARAQLKWPNDVLVGERKVCGILAELRGHVVLGIGINVSQEETELPQHAPTPAGSLLTATGRAPDRAQLLASILERLERRYHEWLVGGLPALHGEITERDALRGRVVTADGRELVARRILEDGRLEVVAPDGELRALDSGEVRLARP
jgi:BirA family biotin operon repressor/biotin-[acetyl-CoA-carboxylase] ligase